MTSSHKSFIFLKKRNKSYYDKLDVKNLLSLDGVYFFIKETSAKLVYLEFVYSITNIIKQSKHDFGIIMAWEMAFNLLVFLAFQSQTFELSSIYIYI